MHFFFFFFFFFLGRVTNKKGHHMSHGVTVEIKVWMETLEETGRREGTSVLKDYMFWCISCPNVRDKVPNT